MVDNKVNESRSVDGGDKLPAQIKYIYNNNNNAARHVGSESKLPVVVIAVYTHYPVLVRTYTHVYR